MSGLPLHEFYEQDSLSRMRMRSRLSFVGCGTTTTKEIASERFRHSDISVIYLHSASPNSSQSRCWRSGCPSRGVRVDASCTPSVETRRSEVGAIAQHPRDGWVGHSSSGCHCADFPPHATSQRSASTRPGLDQAIAAHRRATQQREKLQAQMASLQRQLTDAHDLEAKMAEEEQTARNNLQTQTPVAMAAPTLPVVIVEQTANCLHQELAAAGTLPSAQQLSTAMIQIMETAWQQMVAATQQALLTGAQQLPQQQQQEFMQQEQQALMPEEILRARQQQAQLHNQQQQQQPPLPRAGHLGSGAPTQVDESQMSQSVLQALPTGVNTHPYLEEWGSPSQPMNMDGQ